MVKSITLFPDWSAKFIHRHKTAKRVVCFKSKKYLYGPPFCEKGTTTLQTREIEKKREKIFKKYVSWLKQRKMKSSIKTLYFIFDDWNMMKSMDKIRKRLNFSFFDFTCLWWDPLERKFKREYFLKENDELSLK